MNMAAVAIDGGVVATNSGYNLFWNLPHSLVAVIDKGLVCLRIEVAVVKWSAASIGT